MASSLGTGALTLAGGVNQYIGGETSPLRLGIIVAVIVTTFVISAASGLQKGIARFSSLNAILLLILGIFAFVAGPTIFSLALGVESFGVFLDGFSPKACSPAPLAKTSGRSGGRFSTGPCGFRGPPWQRCF